MDCRSMEFRPILNIYLMCQFFGFFFKKTLLQVFVVSILMSEVIKNQILPPQPLLQENSYTRLLFHQQFFCPSARHYDISARTKTSSLNCHQPCLRRIKTPQLPPCDVPQKCHFYPQQVTPQLTVSMSFQGEGAEGGKGERRWQQPLT